MKEELQEKLFQKYPKLFKQKDLSLKESCMPRGIEIEGDGWYWLLDKLCECIQLCIDRNRLEQIEFEQVKEKLGRLCIYTNYENKTIDGMIWFADHLSCSICEHCGSNEGNITQTAGPLKTLCVKCR
jgi:streptogramin lyase